MTSRLLKFERLALLIGGVYFLFFTLFLLDRRYFTLDECMRAVDALNEMDYFKGLVSGQGLDWPILMFHPYIGALPSYIVAAFFALLGVSVWAERLPVVLMGFMSIFLIYFALKTIFGRKIALGSALLLAFNCNFIQYSRCGFQYEEVLQVFLLWAGISALCLYLDRQKSYFLYTGFFLFGLAFWAKIMFAGYMIGAFLGLLAMPRFGFSFLRNNLFPNWKNWMLAAAAFLVGSLPFWAYNLQSRGESFNFLVERMHNVPGSEYAVWQEKWNNAEIKNNLVFRLQQMDEMVSTEFIRRTDEFHYQDFFTRPLFADAKEAGFKISFFEVVFGTALLTLLAYLLFARKETIPKKPAGFMLLVYFVCFLLSVFSPSYADHCHLIYLKPVEEFILASFFVLLGTWVGRWLWVPAILLYAGAYVYTHTLTNVVVLKHVEYVREAGFAENWTVYEELGKYLKSESAATVYAVESSYVNFEITSRGLKYQLLPSKYKGDDLPAEADRLYAIIKEKGSGLLVWKQSPAGEGILRQLLEKLSAGGRDVRLLKTFGEHDLKTTLLVYRVN